jgi:regulator of sirC expression with transglutaminase-like and TPR domain
MTGAPHYCRSSAYELFVAQLKTLEETDSLLRATVAVAMHELADTTVESVESVLDGLAAEIQGRVQTGSRQALVARLHEVLFDEFGLRGNTDDYYSTENSYVPRVLVRRQGIPVTLALIYKCVAQRVGLTVRGINAPVHFLAAIEADDTSMIVDPFHGGRVLTQKEALDQIEQLSNGTVTRSNAVLATATHAQWISRIIRNLEQIFHTEGRHNDELAMGELISLVAAID